MFILQIDVEHGKDDRNDIYYIGPFDSPTDATTYAETYHGTLDGHTVLQVSAPRLEGV